MPSESNTTADGSAPRWWVSKFTLPDGGVSFSEMWGTASEVGAVAARRGFDVPKKKSLPIKEMRPSKIAAALPGGLANPNVLHALCYLGFLAARSGVVTPEELVQDGSALHELAHYLCGVRTLRGQNMEQLVLSKMRELEERTPGVPPADVEIALS